MCLRDFRSAHIYALHAPLRVMHRASSEVTGVLGENWVAGDGTLRAKTTFRIVECFARNYTQLVPQNNRVQQ
jgi:hypothetical protein